MVLRPDRRRFWRRWRARWPRLVVIIAAAAMVTLLLAAIDWTPLAREHLEWLVTVAAGLLAVVWAGVLLVAVALAFVTLALRTERVEINSGTVRRRLAFGRTREVSLEGAALTRTARADIVTGGNQRLMVPHLFYALEQLDGFWEAAGLSVTPT